MSINRVTLAGNLTRDPEIRVTQGGTPVMEFGIAVNERVKNSQTGEWEDSPNFFDCAMFGTRAEAVSKYLSKGMKVTIDGKLRWQSWEKDGQKRSKVSVLINELELPPRVENSQQIPQQNQPQYNQAPPIINGVYAAPQPAPMPQQQYGYTQASVNYPAVSYQQPALVQQQPALYDDDIPF